MLDDSRFQIQHSQFKETNVKNTPKSKIKYKIEFPPGNMGLDLEPVVVSSEREIGCRVKDFYFGVDHEGIDPNFIYANISVGDIITAINGEDIKSWPFTRILEKLRSLREVKKTLHFKNITAACKIINFVLFVSSIYLNVF